MISGRKTNLMYMYTTYPRVCKYIAILPLGESLLHWLAPHLGGGFRGRLTESVRIELDFISRAPDHTRSGRSFYRAKRDLYEATSQYQPFESKRVFCRSF